MTFTARLDCCSRVSDLVRQFHPLLNVMALYCTENYHLTDPEEIESALKLGEYIKNGAIYLRY